MKLSYKLVTIIPIREKKWPHWRELGYKVFAVELLHSGEWNYPVQLLPDPRMELLLSIIWNLLKPKKELARTRDEEEPRRLLLAGERGGRATILELGVIYFGGYAGHGKTGRKHRDGFPNFSTKTNGGDGGWTQSVARGDILRMDLVLRHTNWYCHCHCNFTVEYTAGSKEEPSQPIRRVVIDDVRTWNSPSGERLVSRWQQFKLENGKILLRPEHSSSAGIRVGELLSPRSIPFIIIPI